MTNPICRFFALCAGVPCAECGGYFRPEKMKVIYRGLSLLYKDGHAGIPHFDAVYYCQVCEPLAPIVFTLRDEKGNLLDERFFQVAEGWFQDVNEDTGEEQYVVSLEDYGHLWCVKCGEYVSNEWRCKSCLCKEKKEMKEKKEKAKS